MTRVALRVLRLAVAILALPAAALPLVALVRAPSFTPLEATDASAAPNAAAARADAEVSVLFQRYALNALLVPALDEAEHPALWADPERTMPCADTPAQAWVDGRPLQAGREQSGRAFTLRWQLQDCWPLGMEGPHLSGSAELDVFRDDDGLTAIVRLQDLTVHARGRSVHLSRHFAARMP